MRKSLRVALLAASARLAAAANYTTVGLNVFSQQSEGLSVQVISPGSGVTFTGPSLTIAPPPPIFPCANGFMPSPEGGMFVVPSNNSGLVFISATNGTLVRNVTLNPPYQLPMLAYYPVDGKLYSIGAPVGGSAFLELVSIDVTTGAVTQIGPVLTNDVMPCSAYPLDPGSGLFVFSYIGPLQMQVLGGVVINNQSSAQAFNVAINNGSLQAMAPLPQAKDGSQAVLFIAQDGLGSLQALQALDTASGNTSVLIPIDERYVNMYQGTLTYDVASNTAALVAGHVAPDGTVFDVLMTFDLSGMARSQEGIYCLPNAGFNVTTLGIAGSDTAPLGFWTIAQLN